MKFSQIDHYYNIYIINKITAAFNISGVYPIQLTNVWNGTKLVFDTSVPEIKEFLSRLELRTHILKSDPAIRKLEH
jgi:hypothetical protein